MKIAHLTSVHPRFDTRIFYKQCKSLAKEGYSVSLIVADNKGDEIINKVNIYDVGASQGRLKRIFKVTKEIFKKAILIDAVIYHLHDPELIPVGLKLRRLGKIVIFDSHEDVPLQIQSKPYLNASLRYLFGQIFSLYEIYACKKMSAIITATPHIRDKFLLINSNSIDINNFPMIDELNTVSNWKKKQDYICYIGGIEVARGIKEMVLAFEFNETNVQLKLAGIFSQNSVRNEVKSYTGWQSVNELGYLDRSGVKEVLNKSIAGLVVLHPIINYIDALPVKMFEYMSAGIPVIASNFPLWIDIIEENNCGLCVNPLEPKSIAKAIDYLVNNPEKAQSMGKKGRELVLKKYNWRIEEQKLFSLYNSFN